MNSRDLKIAKYGERINSVKMPVSMQVGITDHCFNKCQSCGHPQRRKKHIMPFEQWFDFIDKNTALVGPNELETVCFCGGDPMTHAEINKFMALHYHREIDFSMIIAGHLPNHVDRQLLRRARYVVVSLDSINADVYRAMRGGIELAAVLRGIEQMLMVGTTVKLGITVTQQNAGAAVLDVIKYGIALGLEVTVHPMYNQPLPIELQIDVYALQQQYKTASIIVERYIPIKEKLRTKCNAAYYQSYITANGDIYPCCITAGDTMSEPQMQPLGNISYWPEYLKNRLIFSRLSPDKQPDICKTCTGRFVAINHLANDMPCNKSFF